ncbi:NADH-cytochrome B5 reductase [Mycena venus]|uniref:NADH-cytochrome B5 reductase n=1 Tax=Mycena venus TaxID=2733690 RepID=A0A8H7CYX8_9AGAR|nr:NADH-cytochrome B5 reductase [Mycena venus]
MFSRPQARVVSLGLFGAGAAAIYLFLPDKSRHAPTVDDASLAPCHFTRATLTSSGPSGPNTKLLVLTVPGFSKPKHASQLAPIWASTKTGECFSGSKNIPKGEVGRWLHSKKIGDQVEFRGPLSTWAWKEDTWDEVVLISGGTGITPFYQLLHSTFSKGDNNSKTRFTLLHSSPTPSELPPPAILDPLRSYAAAYPEKFALHLFVDSRDGDAPTNLPPLQVSRIGKPAIQHSLRLKPLPWWRIFSTAQTSDNTPRRTLFLVCGPEPMINAIAGPYGRNFSQGPVGGVLGELGYSSNEVRKL